MHQGSLLRMEWFVKNYLKENKAYKILDVGSYDVNGSYKDFFHYDNFDYTGLDMMHGPNVDFVPPNPYRWTNLEDNVFDVVISGQSFEHIEFFWWTLEEMIRVLKPLGFMSLVVPYQVACHRYPIDCYRFLADALLSFTRYGNITPLHISTYLAPVGAPDAWYEPECWDSFLVAQKPANWLGFATPETYTFKEEDIAKYNSGFVQRSQELIDSDRLHAAKLLIKEYRHNKRVRNRAELKRKFGAFFGKK